MKKANKQTPNKQVNKDIRANNFTIVNLSLMLDNRLTHEERNILNILLWLSDNFIIKTKATSKYLGISEPSFIKMLKNYELLGYLERTKQGKITYYKFKDHSDKIDFEPTKIKYYSQTQIEKFINDARTPKKYINLLINYKTTIETAMQDYTNALCKIDNIDIDLSKADLLETKQEEQNEIDFLNYIKGFNND